MSRLLPNKFLIRSDGYYATPRSVALKSSRVTSLYMCSVSTALALALNTSTNPSSSAKRFHTRWCFTPSPPLLSTRGGIGNWTLTLALTHPITHPRTHTQTHTPNIQPLSYHISLNKQQRNNRTGDAVSIAKEKDQRGSHCGSTIMYEDWSWEGNCKTGRF